MYDVIIEIKEEEKKSCFSKVQCVLALSEAEVPFKTCTGLELHTQTCHSLSIIFFFFL